MDRPPRIGFHEQGLLSIGRGKKFHKWPNYEVLELLSTQEEGLYGFHVRFPNGSRSTYTRGKSGTEAINFFFGIQGINFMASLLDALEPTCKINRSRWKTLECASMSARHGRCLMPVSGGFWIVIKLCCNV